MRRRAFLAGISLAMLACGGNPSGAAATPSSSSAATPSAHATASASASAAAPGTLSGNYGLLIVGTNLELVKADGSVAATSPITIQGLQCSSAQDGVNVPPPVSASNHEVYFRDGGRIRMVTPPSGAVDVTTVPNSQTVVSFFTVSPDDQRIAVVVEDVSAAATMSIRLYVEDLRGGGHHADIYSTVVAKGKSPTSLWPVGWHQGYLVLALEVACTFEPVGLYPAEYHVSNATTATRITTIKGANCELSVTPSPAGVGCAGSNGVTTMYDWSNKVLGVTGPGTQFGGTDTGLSPAGNSIYFATMGLAPPATRLVQLGPGPYATVNGHSACAWIDEDHLLSPDAVIGFPAETPGNVQVPTTVTPLPAAGLCAGRFPGGL